MKSLIDLLCCIGMATAAVSVDGFMTNCDNAGDQTTIDNNGRTIAQVCPYGTSSVLFYNVWGVDHVEYASGLLLRFGSEIVLDANNQALLTLVGYDGSAQEYIYSMAIADASTKITQIEFEDGNGQTFNNTYARDYDIDATSNPGIVSITLAYSFGVDLENLSISSFQVDDYSMATLGGADDNAPFDYSAGALNTISVQGADGKNTQDYTVAIRKEAASTVTALSYFNLCDAQNCMSVESYGSTDNVIDNVNHTIMMTASYGDPINLGTLGLYSYYASDNSVATITNADGSALGMLDFGDSWVDAPVSKTIKVTAEDGVTSQLYTLTVVRKRASTETALSYFDLCDAQYNCMSAGYYGSTDNVIDNVNHTIMMTASYSSPVNLGALGLYFYIVDNSAATITNADGSALGMLDFSGSWVDAPVSKTIKVTAEDGVTSQLYMLTVVRQRASTVTALTEFYICNRGLDDDYFYLENCRYADGDRIVPEQGTVRFDVAYSDGFDETSVYLAYWQVSDGSVATLWDADGTTPITSATALSLASPLDIQIKSESGSLQKYTLTFNRGPASTLARLYELDLCDVNNKCAALDNYDGDDAEAFELEMPYGTDFTNLHVSYINMSSYATVSYDPALQPFNLASSKTLMVVVTAEDGLTTKTYTVNLAEATPNAGALLLYAQFCPVVAYVWGTCVDAVVGTPVDNKAEVSVTFPSGTDLSIIAYNNWQQQHNELYGFDYKWVSTGATVTYAPAGIYREAEYYGFFDLSEGGAGMTITVQSEDNNTINVYTVKAFVEGSNSPPIAVADVLTMNEDRSSSVNVLTNDTDADSDNLYAVAKTTADALGTLVITANGSATFTPNTNANGAQIYSYTVTDGKASSTGQLTVTVNAVNDAPIAVADVLNITEDASAVTTLNVLANDKEPDNLAALTVMAIALTTGSKGVYSLAADGVLTYTPKANESGVDAIGYTVIGHGGLMANGTITVNIAAVNDAPRLAGSLSVPDQAEDFAGFSLELGGLFTDVESNAITYSVSKASGVTAQVMDGKLHIASLLNVNGPVSVTLLATDNGYPAASASYTFGLSIAAVDDAVVASSKTLDDTLSVVDGFTPWTFELSKVFSDVDNAIVYSCVAEPTEIVSVSCADGVLQIGNIKGKTGRATIIVTVVDPSGNVSATQSVVVAPTTGVLIQQTDASTDWRSVLRNTSHGMAILTDVQGRVIWQAPLPVSAIEAEQIILRTQGVKLLRINKQSWAIIPANR